MAHSDNTYCILVSEIFPMNRSITDRNDIPEGSLDYMAEDPALCELVYESIETEESLPKRDAMLKGEASKLRL